MWVNLQSIGKNVLPVKNEQIKMILMTDSLPFICLVWPVNISSSDSSWILHFGFSPSWSHFLHLSRDSCLLAWIQTRIWGTGGFGFTPVQTCNQSMFSGLAISNDKYFSKLATYHLPVFCPTIALYKRANTLSCL